MAQQLTFQMRQCLSESCRFRFPVPTASSLGRDCPRCGAATALSGEPFGSYRPEEVAFPRRPWVEGLLDNIRSARNVGAIFRAADGAGLHHLHLGGITATPRHHKVGKTALGAEHSVPWTAYNNSLDAARLLREKGYRLWGLESSESSRSLFSLTGDEIDLGGAPILLIVGHERAGVDPAILALCQRRLYIPMQGVKESLNVGIAFGIAAYALRYTCTDGS